MALIQHRWIELRILRSASFLKIDKMKALILAAGYGRRLYPITKEYPKPLLMVDSRPIIDYIINKLERLQEIDSIWVITNNKFFSQFIKWEEQINCKKPINLINDQTSTYETRLGALGDINFAIKTKNLKDDLLIIGGDNLFDENLDSFISSIEKNNPYTIVGVYDIKDKTKAIHYGVVSIDEHRRIIDFQEKPAKPKSSLIAMCLYYFPKKKLSLLSEYLTSKDKDQDAAGNFINWLYKKEEVLAFIFKGHWYDIGQHDSYKEAEGIFKKINEDTTYGIK